jgi:hypothetical protein
MRSILMPAAERSRPTAKARKRWRDARAFQADVQLQLAREHVPFAMWLLLETLQELLDETGDAVSQNALAERSGLTRQVTSYWMIIMDEAALIDRGPHPNIAAWRVILTDLGERTLLRCNERLEAAGLTG